MPTDPTRIPGWKPPQDQGAGVATADLSGDGRPDLVVLAVDGRAEQNSGRYRVGRSLDASGAVSGGWGAWQQIPGWRFRSNADAAIALADLDGSGQADLIVFAIEVRDGTNRGYYRVGRSLDADGAVTGGWTGWTQIPGWFSTDNQGGDIAVADLNGDGTPELVVVIVDKPTGGHYRVGWSLDATGKVAGEWDEWTAIPDWQEGDSKGLGIDVADLDGDGRPELLVLDRGRHTIGWGLDETGCASEGWGPWTDPPGGRVRTDTSAALVCLVDGERPALMALGSGAVAAAPVEAPDEDEAATRGVWRILDHSSQILAVHAALLHTGDVLFFSGSGADPDDHEARRFRTRVWHYPSRRFSSPRTPIDLFCAGQTFLAGGRLLAAGGTGQYGPFRGIRDALVFDPEDRRWIRVRRMLRPRWYPTLTTLGDGRVLSVSGRGAGRTLERMPEIFETGEGWRRLPSPGLIPWYPHLFLLASGRIFYSGGQMSGNRGVRPMIWNFSNGNTRVVPGLPQARIRNQSASVLLGDARNQRVMIIGGGGAEIHQHGDDDEHPFEDEEDLPHVATTSTAIVDLSDGNPRYRAAARMNEPRMHLNATILPERTILANGGARVEEHRVDASLHAELYNPRTRRWRLGARSRVPRLYHSTAILTPDGRVVTAGSNPRPKADELRIEVFSPPYLFRGPRPQLTLARNSVRYGGRMQATVPGAADLREVNLLRPGATTHAFNCEQRLLELDVEVTAPDRITLTFPRRRNIAPPGWYMVFAISADGVPSVGRFVRLG